MEWFNGCQGPSLRPLLRRSTPSTPAAETAGRSLAAAPGMVPSLIIVLALRKGATPLLGGAICKSSSFEAILSVHNHACGRSWTAAAKTCGDISNAVACSIWHIRNRSTQDRQVVALVCEAARLPQARRQDPGSW